MLNVMPRQQYSQQTSSASRRYTTTMPTQYSRIRAAVVAMLAFLNQPAQAGVFQDGDTVMVQAAPGVIHYNSSPDHKGHAWLIGVEWQAPSHWLAGASYFNNSFDQKCEYLYGGKSWPMGFSSLYFKLVGGLLLGYKEPFENKIPFNHNGVAPGIIPALGYKKEKFSVQVNLLGTAGMMITVGYDGLK